MRDDIIKSIEKLSINYGVDDGLIKSIVQWESSFNPNAISESNAKGLMQLTDLTFKHVRIKYKKKWHADEIFDPEVNIEAGIIYLKELIKLFTSKVEEAYILHYALASYQSGPTKVRKDLRLIEKKGNPKNWESLRPYLSSKTIAYVKNVLSLRA